ncbi:lectin-like domain-containing protein [Telluribacter sp.]|jgi:gliding motility-associated-like protein|uniref:lectin-like domain-containing protein n=1 Tax=Telluribacter sp. TaxID=1978767 RepID=UPI002E1043BC|nr:gliding motility-associated C-terminal domain-containing protein [Telluribacter sp.]
MLLRVLLVVWVSVCCAGSDLFGQSYNLLGSTTAIGGDCYRITEDIPWQNGAVWYTQKLNLASSFDIEFTMNFGNKDAGGADGMVFVLQTRGNNALGPNGRGLGFADFLPSLGIEFDTHSNTSASESEDPRFDHIAILRNGNVNHSATNPDNLAGPVQALSGSANIEDGKDHLVRIVWNAAGQTLEVYFDCEKRLSSSVDMASIFGNEKLVWWGFTGGTGQLSNQQVVCLRKDIVVKDTFQICQGEAIQLVARNSSNGQYSWSPAQLLDNPTSKSPMARPEQDQLFVVSYLDKCDRPVRDSIFVKVGSAFNVDLGEDRSTCQEKAVTLSPQVAGTTAALQYQWSTGETTPIITVGTTGTYILTVSSGDCQVKDTVQVEFLSVMTDLPVVSDVCIANGPLRLTTSLSETTNSYFWTHSRTTAFSTLVSEPGTYELITTTTSGCQFRERFEVNKWCDLMVWIPDAFSPNADGHNDNLSVRASGAVDLHWTIYDRWGNAIFHSQNIDEPWDGYFHNVLCQPGPYAWKAQYRPKSTPDAPYFIKRGVVWLVK